MYLKEKIEFLTTNTQSLMDYGLPKQRAYILSTGLMAAAFRNLFKDHVGVAYQFNAKDMVSIAGLIWHHLGLTLDKQEKVSEENFKGDPIISGEYVKFMVKIILLRRLMRSRNK